MRPTNAEIRQQALRNAIEGESTANYAAIFEGFAAKGIPEDQVRPRENVFTFNAWKALGRFVRKGEHGVRVGTRVAYEATNEDTGKVERRSRPKATTVFHISQTEATASEAAPP